MKGDEYMRYVDNVNKEKPKKEAEKQNLKPIQALKNLNCNLIKAK
jgi:hypothetical protein